MRNEVIKLDTLDLTNKYKEIEMTRKKLLMLIGSVCLALVLVLPVAAGCAAPAPTPTPTPTPELPSVKWDLYNWELVGTYPATAVSELIEKISDRTDGKFQITGYYGGLALGFDQGEIQFAIRDGIIDIGAISLGGASGVIPWFGIFQRPGLCSWPEGLYQLSDAVSPVFQRELTKMFDITPVMFFTSFPQQLWTVTPVEDVTDLGGLKVRVWDEATASLSEAMGGMTILLSFQEVYLALQLGTIKGVITGNDGVLAGSLWEFVKHGYLVGMSTPTYYMAYNNESFERLPDEYKTILLEELERWSKEYALGLVEWDARVRVKLEAKGVQLHELSVQERLVIGGRLIPLWQEWADKGGPIAQELLDIAFETLGY